MRKDKPKYHEDQFVAEVQVWGPPAGGGMKSLNIELASTVSATDIDGKHIPDPLVEVIRRGADVLEEKLANREFGVHDIFAFTVHKTAVRNI